MCVYALIHSCTCIRTCACMCACLPAYVHACLLSYLCANSQLGSAYTLLPLLDHASSTRLHQLHLSWDNLCSCPHKLPICCPSASEDCLHVFQHLHFFHVSCEFHQKAFQTVLEGFPRAWPSQPLFLVLICHASTTVQKQQPSCRLPP